MKTSGVVVGGSIRIGVFSAVGASLVGAMFTDRSHAKDAIIKMERKKKILFTVVLFMVAFPFMHNHSEMRFKTPPSKGEFSLSVRIVYMDCACEGRYSLENSSGNILERNQSMNVHLNCMIVDNGGQFGSFPTILSNQ